MFLPLLLKCIFIAFIPIIISIDISPRFGLILDTFRSIPKMVRVLSSSAIEALVLSCSMPNNYLPNEKDILKILQFINKTGNTLVTTDDEAIIDDVVSLSMKEIIHKDWRSAAKALYSIHRIIQGCSAEQSKMVARNVIERIYRTDEAITHMLNSTSKSYLFSPSRSDWLWVKAYFNYLHILCDSKCGESSMQYFLVISGPEDLIKITNALLNAARIVLSELTNINSSLMKQMIEHCRQLISIDILHFIDMISKLHYPEDASDEMRKRDAYATIAKSLQGSLEEIFELLKISLPHEERPRLPGWITDI